MTTVVRHPIKNHTNEGKGMVLTIKRLMPAVTHRYTMAEGAASAARLDKAASARNA
jgi:hypothetical protein